MPALYLHIMTDKMCPKSDIRWRENQLGSMCQAKLGSYVTVPEEFTLTNYIAQWSGFRNTQRKGNSRKNTTIIQALTFLEAIFVFIFRFCFFFVCLLVTTPRGSH